MRGGIAPVVAAISLVAPVASAGATPWERYVGAGLSLAADGNHSGNVPFDGGGNPLTGSLRFTTLFIEAGVGPGRALDLHAVVAYGGVSGDRTAGRVIEILTGARAVVCPWRRVALCAGFQLDSGPVLASYEYDGERSSWTALAIRAELVIEVRPLRHWRLLFAAGPRSKWILGGDPAQEDPQTGLGGLLVTAATWG